MERNANTSRKRSIILPLLTVVIFGLFGCAQMGRNVPAENRITFSDRDSGQGTYDSNRLAVDYTYNLRGGDLNLAGNASYRGRYDSLNVYVLFIDPVGNVLDRKIVYSSGYRVFKHWQPDKSFEVSFALPDGVSGFSFDHYTRPRTMRDQ